MRERKDINYCFLSFIDARGGGRGMIFFAIKIVVQRMVIYFNGLRKRFSFRKQKSLFCAILIDIFI